jgi:hypothetical protein
MRATFCVRSAHSLQVLFGGGTHSALGVALLRTGGIITGVLLFMGLTVVILPKSATIEALRCVCVQGAV